MKLRARRIAILAALAGAGVVAVLVVAHWSTVRDHVEAWYFHLTRETQITRGFPDDVEFVSVILEGSWQVFRDYHVWAREDLSTQVLKENGYRVLEQRFPRRAYVVIRDQGATP